MVCDSLVVAGRIANEHKNNIKWFQPVEMECLSSTGRVL